MTVRGLTLRRITPLVLLAVATFALLVWPGFLRDEARYVIVSGQSMEPALHTGDVVVTVPRPAYDAGDVVAYRIPRGEPGEGVLVIHRIVGGSAASGYILRGDNRRGRDPWRPKPHDILGEQSFTMPKVGLALGYLRTPLVLAALAALATALLIAGGSSGAHSRDPGEQPIGPYG